MKPHGSTDCINEPARNFLSPYFHVNTISRNSARSQSENVSLNEKITDLLLSTF